MAKRILRLMKKIIRGYANISFFREKKKMALCGKIIAFHFPKVFDFFLSDWEILNALPPPSSGVPVA